MIEQLIYDEYEIIKSELEYVKQERENDDFYKNLYGGLSDEKIVEILSGDDDLFSNRWDEFMWDIGELLNLNDNPLLEIEGYNMGWRHSNGKMTLRCCDISNLFHKILPNTDINRFEVTHENAQLKIRIWHHDSPMGKEYYIIRKIDEDDINDSEI